MAPIPVGVQKLAAQLARRMPWLARDRHIGALARLLHRHKLDVDAGWSAGRLLAVLEQHLRGIGRQVPDPAQQRNPLGYLNALLTAAAPALEAHAVRQQLQPPALPSLQAPPEQPRIITEADRRARAAVIAQIRADIAVHRAAVGARTVEVRRPRWAKR